MEKERKFIVFVLLAVFFTYKSGVSATCVSDPDDTIAVFSSRDIDVISNIPAVPRCIRCAYLPSNFIPVFVTDPNDVSYFDKAGDPIVNGSINGVIVFDDGLLVEDAAGSFNNDDTIRCNFNDGTSSGSRTITFKISVFLPPPITPNGTVLDYVEGDNVTLTCTGDSNANDAYQWTLPDGSLIPSGTATDADSGLALTLKNVNRTDSGVYTCTGTISDISPTVSVESNVTLNIQYTAKVFTFSTSTNILPVTTTLTLNCTFEGNPTPSVLWFHNDTVIAIQNNPTNDYATFDVTFTSINDTGLYSCGVNNSVGNNGSSEILVTAQVAPGPVSIFQNDSSTSTSITLSWSYGFEGNAPITGVDITYSATSKYGNGLNMGDERGSISTDQLSLTISNLQPLTTYELSITVNNSVSDTVGSSSAVTVSADTLPIAPYAPTSVIVTPIDSTSLTISWSASVDSSIQTPLMGFVIQYNTVGNSTTKSIMITDGTATSHDITGLRKGTMYQVRVQSGNSAGNSPFSDDGQGRTDIDAPSAVVGLQPTSNPFSICVQWSEPEDNGGQDINGYTIYLWNKDDFEMENYVFVSSVGATVLTYTVENLDNDTEYFIRVAASNEDQGLGMNSTVNATTGQPLQVDPDFNVTVFNRTAVSAIVAWRVTSNNVQYRLQFVQEGADFDPDRYTNLTANMLQTTINNLDPRTTYDVRLTRIEGGGCTRRVSEIMPFTTLALQVEIPSPPNEVVEGSEVVLQCRLNTGGIAPDVTWKYEGGPLPEGAVVNGSRLILANPIVNNTGNYSCTSREGTPDEDTFSFFLMVQPPVVNSTSSSSLPTASETPTLEKTETLPVWVIGVIAAGAFICIVVFVIVLIVFIYCCCKKATGEKESGRYDLAKPAKSSTGMWLDEGASGFSSVITTSGNDHDAPVNRGRTMTNDYVSATSFNTIDKKGSTDKLYEEDPNQVKIHSDV